MIFFSIKPSFASKVSPIHHGCRTVLLLFFATATLTAFAQRPIHGKVRSEDGSIVPGASVQIKGAATATQADKTGQFALNATSNAILVVSAEGFETREIIIGKANNINITLSSIAAQWQQVGYGTQRKALFAGSAASVTGAAVMRSPTINVSNSLAGRLPGVFAVSPSGEPGYDGSVLYVRGVNTLGGNNNPLIVVDGVPGRSLERIDPNAVESITVLKDASAAIYGAQAANGVILVTTRKGKAGKLAVTASFDHGYGQPTRTPKMADAATYATMLNEIAEYAGNTPKYSEEEIQKFKSGADPWRYPNTDWFKEVLRPWSAQNAGNVSLNGGSETMRYFVLLTGRTQEGFYRSSGTRYSQYDFRTNLDGNAGKNITLGLDLAGRLEDRNLSSRSAASIFRMVMRGRPTDIARWPNGLPGPGMGYGDNPVVTSTNATGYDKDKQYVFNSNARLTVNIPQVPGLSVSGNAAIDLGFQLRKLWQTPWAVYVWDGIALDPGGTPVLQAAQRGYNTPTLAENTDNRQRILLNGMLNYEHRFAAAHNATFMAGAERITEKGDYFAAGRSNFTTAILDQLNFGGQDQFLTNSGAAYRLARLNYFGRATYDYNEKYLLSLVWRYQNSSRFDPRTGKGWGLFPGVSVGYKISNEGFFRKNIPAVDDLKLRASWGKTGLDDAVQWNYLTTYAFGGTPAQSYNPPLPFVTNGTVENPALYELRAANASATWETATQADIGFDVALLHNRLLVTADYFFYKRSGILVQRNASVPASSGFVPPAENIGKASNRGFDFAINFRGSGTVSYAIGLNGGYSKNRIDFMDEAESVPAQQKATGHPINSALYFKAVGIFRDQDEVDSRPHWAGARPGDVIFEDVSGPGGKPDGQVDAWDQVRIDKSAVPRFSGGITGNLRYRDFDLSILLQGASGAVRYTPTESGEAGNFLESFAKNRWTGANPSASGPRTFNGSDNEYWVAQANTFWLLKTDYVRLKNIELGYNFSSSLIRKTKLQSLRIHINAYNLFTYSPGMTDFDPELGNGNGQTYPVPKIVNIGALVSF